MKEKLDLSNVCQKYNYKTLFFNDFISRVEPLIKKGGWYIRMSDGKLVKELHDQNHNYPWIPTPMKVNRNCLLKNHVLFHCFGVIHSECYSCYKVIVTLNTVEELFMLHDLMQHLGYDGKCGMEERPWVKGNYKGYFYTESYEAGLERLKQVRKAVGNHISKNISIKLKRACTEFEHGRGPSSKWKYTNDDLFWEKYVTKVTEIPDLAEGMLSKEIQIHTMFRWLQKAYKIGDDTAKKFNYGQDLISELESYDIGKPMPALPTKPSKGIFTGGINAENKGNGNKDSVPAEVSIGG